MKPIVIESPYAGEVHRNLIYLDFCKLDCLRRGETPYASHGQLTSCLDDNKPEERELGIAAGLAMAEFISNAAFYTDLDWSRGMTYARAYYEIRHMRFELRTLPPDLLEQFKQRVEKLCSPPVVGVPL
jgi:hypothetical protein